MLCKNISPSRFINDGHKLLNKSIRNEFLVFVHLHSVIEQDVS